jgi:ADP-ribose pyrophosphatase YjhB (NUDIX family)
MIYDYCPKCGGPYSTQTENNKLFCLNCDVVTYLNSKPTASTLIIDGDKVLLGKRRSEPAKGKWDVIGGFLDYHEHPEVGAIREAKEETGLDVKVEKLLGIFMDEYGPDKYSTLNICYVVSVIGGNPIAGDDIEELKWFSSNQIPSDIAFKNGKDMLGIWQKTL